MESYKVLTMTCGTTNKQFIEEPANLLWYMFPGVEGKKADIRILQATEGQNEQCSERPVQS
ncbi:MAG: hypothetical protein CMF67_03985 [Magnetovibrio sp.]|nr:hypothetical protein [Magnetovibrio sp.]